jgi:hypothetical protein
MYYEGCSLGWDNFFSVFSVFIYFNVSRFFYKKNKCSWYKCSSMCVSLESPGEVSLHGNVTYGNVRKHNDLMCCHGGTVAIQLWRPGFRPSHATPHGNVPSNHHEFNTVVWILVLIYLLCRSLNGSWWRSGVLLAISSGEQGSNKRTTNVEVNWKTLNTTHEKDQEVRA